MDEREQKTENAVPVHTKRMSYYAVVDAEKFARNPFGQCYLADGADDKQRLVYKGNINAWGSVIRDAAILKAEETERITGKPHKAVCFEIVKNVWEA